MRRPGFVVLISVVVAACASRYTPFQELDRIAFRRQDSSFVNQSVDALILTGTPFLSLSWMGVRPKEILVSRGDSTWLYRAVGVYVTFLSDRAFDACVPPSRASLMAWKDLPSRAGIEQLYLFAAGNSAGMRDTFSVTSSDCNGPMLTLHHPMFGMGKMIGRQFHFGDGATSTGRGSIHIGVGNAGSRPCPSSAVTGLASQNLLAECRLTWMQVWVDTRVRPGRGGAISDTVVVKATVPALHIWIDCRGKRKSHSVCPPLPYGQLVREPAPPPNPLAGLPPAPPLVTVTGIIKDEVEGVPIPYARVRFDRTVLVYADSTGRFTVPLPPGRPAVLVECFGRDGSFGRSQDPIVVRPYMADLALFLNGRNCRRPPDPVADAVFEGRYDPGLERSRFILCGNRIPTVWAELGPIALADRDRLLALLKGKESFAGFVWKVRGSLAGPGRFGKPATSDYLLTIERVEEIRVRQPNECYR